MAKRKWFKIMTWGLILFGVVLILFLARKFSRDQDSSICKGIVVEIKQINGIKYIKAEEVEKFVLQKYPSITRQNIGSLDLDSIESVLSEYAFVRNAEVYTDLDQKLHVEIEQMIPLLRVHPDQKKPYYLSKEGKTTPLSELYTAHVLVATGTIPDSMNSKLYTLARYVNESKVWNAQIEQIFVTRDQDIILVPKLGKFSIALGGVDQLEQKFAKLTTFFKEGLNKTGWDKYKSIDLKYNKLIICK